MEFQTPLPKHKQHVFIYLFKNSLLLVSHSRSLPPSLSHAHTSHTSTLGLYSCLQMSEPLVCPFMLISLPPCLAPARRAPCYKANEYSLAAEWDPQVPAFVLIIVLFKYLLYHSAQLSTAALAAAPVHTR